VTLVPKPTRLGLLLVAIAVAVAAPLTFATAPHVRASQQRNEVTRKANGHHDQSAVVRLHRLARADRALKHSVDAWWAVPFVLAALVGGWALRALRRADRHLPTIVAFRRRGPPPVLPLVV
jgi:hypothetical protein